MLRQFLGGVGLNILQLTSIQNELVWGTISYRKLDQKDPVYFNN